MKNFANIFGLTLNFLALIFGIVFGFDINLAPNLGNNLAFNLGLTSALAETTSSNTPNPSPINETPIQNPASPTQAFSQQGKLAPVPFETKWWEVGMADTNSSLVFASGGHVIELSFSAGYFMSPVFEWAISGSWQNASSQGDTANVITLLTGPVINFVTGSEELNSAFFIGFGAGFTMGDDSSSDSESKFTWGGSLGRRVAITESICYKPTIGVSKITDVTDIMFTVTPLSFSALF